MGVFDELKSVASTLQEAGKIDQYRQILDAQKELLEMQKRIFDLEFENRELKEAINKKKKLINRAEVYYSIEDGKEDGPFCTLCYDVRGKLVRMNYWNENCKKCNNCEKIYSFIEV